MDDLTVCRLSGEALGKRVSQVYLRPNDLEIRHANGSSTLWNPLLNAEQRWECVEYLVKLGEVRFEATHKFIHFKEPSLYMIRVCPASEFPARAVAELQLREEKA